MDEIKVKIHEEADLYNRLDPDQRLIDDSIVSYITRRHREIGPGEEFCVHIISDLPVDEERVRKNFRAYLEHDVDIDNDELRFCSVRQFRLFLIGIFFIAVWLVAQGQTDSVIVEVLSIIGSFAVWEAACIWIEEKPRIRYEKLKKTILKETEIKFSVNGE
jgi:hypothetical protein